MEDGDGSDGSQGSVLEMMPGQEEPRDGFATYGLTSGKSQVLHLFGSLFSELNL